MPRKTDKITSCAENQFDVKSLPNEVWCILFSYLGKKSLRNSTATCKHWFELIRNDSNLSGQVCLPNDGLLELKRKINDSQWIWTRWPVLQTIEFRKLFVCEKFKEIYFENERFTPAHGTNKEIVKYLSQSNSFRDSLRLDKIVCCVAWHLTGIFTHLPNLPQNFGLIYGLTINPKNKIEFVGIEHVYNLEFSVEDSRFSEDIDESFTREIVQAIKLVGDNGRNLKYLTISFPMFPCWINLELSRVLGDAFIDMFKALKKFKSLQIVELNSAFLSLDGFSNVFGEMVTHLIVKDMPFNTDTLSEISQKFPNLTSFCVGNAFMKSEKIYEDIHQSLEELPKLVEKIFHSNTRVEIQLHLTTWTYDRIDTVVEYEFSKVPFHKCVMKKLAN